MVRAPPNDRALFITALSSIVPVGSRRNSVTIFSTHDRRRRLCPGLLAQSTSSPFFDAALEVKSTLVALRSPSIAAHLAPETAWAQVGFPFHLSRSQHESCACRHSGHAGHGAGHGRQRRRSVAGSTPAFPVNDDFDNAVVIGVGVAPPPVIAALAGGGGCACMLSSADRSAETRGGPRWASSSWRRWRSPSDGVVAGGAETPRRVAAPRISVSDSTLRRCQEK